MRKFLSQLLSLVLVLSMAIPASAQAVVKAKQQRLKANVEVMQAKDIRQAGPLGKHKTFVKGQGQFQQMHFAKPGKKYAAAPLQASSSANFFANIVYNDTWTEDEPTIYSISTTAPGTYEAVTTESIQIMGGTATPTQLVGVYYFSLWGMYFVTNYVYDLNTWELVSTTDGDGISDIAIDMCYDPETENIYGLFFSETGYGVVVSTYDPTTGTHTVLNTTDLYYDRIAADLEGNIYLASQYGDFGKLDKETGEVTTLGNFGVTSDYSMSSAIDYRTGLFYYATCPETANSELYVIDPAKPNEATLVYTYDSNIQFTCAYFTLPEAEDKAPDKGNIESVNFAGTSLSGTIEFTAPAALYDDSTPASGETLSYEVLANGEVIAQGTEVQYGHAYKLAIKVPASGLYTFTVVFTNSVGASPKSNKVTVYIGNDSPAQVENVVAAYADDKITLTWNAVTEGAHDGILGNVTYSVYDAATDSLLAEALTATTYSFDYTAPKAFTTLTYKIVATADGLESKAGLSNMIILGAIQPPYESSLKGAENVIGWTFVDNNNDGSTWSASENGLKYTYNSRNQADDYAISPAVDVERGKLYNLSYIVAASSVYYPESAELVALTDPTNVSNGTVVIAPVTTSSTEMSIDASGNYLATYTGQVYFAVHCVSAADRYNCYVSNLSISAGINGKLPSEATDLSVVPNNEGQVEGELFYTTPTKAIDGTALTGLSKVEVLVNDEIIYVDNAPATGVTSSVKYQAEVSGIYTFTVICYNEEGAGLKATTKMFLGINVPAAPTAATVKEVADGVVTINWVAPTKDQDGFAINPELITYTVIDGYSGETAADDVVGTELANYKAVAEGEQALVGYVIFAKTAAGTSENYAMTSSLAVGTPYVLPFEETLEGGELKHEWALARTSENISCLVATDATFSDLTSRNNDGGFFLIQSQYGDEAARITGPKVAITDANPYLTFYTYCIAANDENTLDVDFVVDGSETVSICTVTLGDGNLNQWNRQSVDLKAYAGKQIQPVFTGTINSYANIIFDDITIGDPVNYDLFAQSISAPTTKLSNSEFDIEYTIANLGLKEAKGYKVQFYADGDLLLSLDTLPAIAAGSVYTGAITHAPYSLFEAGHYEFSYVIEYAEDEDLANNGSTAVGVNIANTNYPTVEIEGALADSVVTLSWEDVLIDLSSSEITEDFESNAYTPWVTDQAGDWTMLNFNQEPTYIVQGTETPVGGDAFGFVLYNAEEAGLSSTSNVWGYDGPQFMAAFAHEAGANDAWLISPQMMGIQQTIKFMAKAATTQYGPETMECYYSTTGKDVADFTKVEISNYDEASGVTEEWEEYSFSIPAGAKYFAIRSTAEDTFILMIDNITYAGPSTFLDLEFKGFDVYRDEVKLNAEPITETTYTDTLAEFGDYTYNVVVVYNNGMSAPSNSYVAEYKDVDGLASATAASSIAVEGNTIVVKGATKVSIAAVDGKVVYNAAGQDSYAATVAAGVYVVKTNDATAKVIVK